MVKIMPFTPFHMGPGILAKAMLQGGFSLMVFGWTQIVMDLQPLVAIITGEGHLHGFTHTYIGSSLIAVFSAVTGKYTAELALIMIYKNIQQVINIRWRVAYLSAFIGAYSHVILDKNSMADFIFRTKLPFKEEQAIEQHQSFWQYLESLMK